MFICYTSTPNKSELKKVVVADYYVPIFGTYTLYYFATH
jgi:hypothetical protein